MKRIFSMIWLLSLAVFLAFGTCMGCDDNSDSSEDDDDDNDDNDNDDNNDDNDDDNNNDDNDDDDSDSVCDDVNFPISGKVVDVLIVLDRSGSMDQDNLWIPMGEALTEVTAVTEMNVNFGLTTYPRRGSDCETGENIIDVGPQNADEIAAVVGGGSDDMGANGGTPTAPTLSEAKDYLDGLSDDYEKYVLLATDGAPNCNDSLDGSTCVCTWGNDCSNNPTNCLDDVESIAAAAEVFAAGYPVYVLGIGGSSEWAAVMDNIAEAGGTDHYISAESDEFVDVLLGIIGEVMSCEFFVDWDALGPDVDHDPSKVNFYCKQSMDEPNTIANLIPFDPDCAVGGGWDWIDDNNIVFCPGMCERLKNGECRIISATFGCESEIIIP